MPAARPASAKPWAPASQPAPRGGGRLETTRRYTLPIQADMEAAVAHLPADE
ncbi:hypothetical protein [Nocardiopsis flavescens]|uniref:hypothetical protein n=1 Tax=Nocardiopsis flavescens TaxID=758803 RepID=UPI0015BB2AFF|nr:hypothetical protein [Nocardiopsis flavescens]